MRQEVALHFDQLEKSSRLNDLELEAKLGLTDFLDIFGPKHQDGFASCINQALMQLRAHGKFEHNLNIIESIQLTPDHIDLDRDAPLCRFSSSSSLASDPSDFTSQLEALGPWKKGPFQLGTTLLDAEWRSDSKWTRLMQHLGSVRGDRLLDVGTGNGYFLLRAMGAGARCVLGIEPSVPYVSQYLALRKFFNIPHMGMITTSAEQFPQNVQAFDTVLSMGVLYHRRSPLDHLLQLKSFIRPEGRLVIETIVVDGPAGYCLTPEGRYANMNNVWFIPSLLTLCSWLRKLNIKDIEAGPIVTTTQHEQRSTTWSGPVSLAQALDPTRPNFTIEGHAAPKRVIVSGRVL